MERPRILLPAAIAAQGHAPTEQFHLAPTIAFFLVEASGPCLQRERARLGTPSRFVGVFSNDQPNKPSETKFGYDHTISNVSGRKSMVCLTRTRDRKGLGRGARKGMGSGVQHSGPMRKNARI